MRSGGGKKVSGEIDGAALRLAAWRDHEMFRLIASSDKASGLLVRIAMSLYA